MKTWLEATLAKLSRKSYTAVAIRYSATHSAVSSTDAMVQWSLRGAHLPLQTWTKVLNDELDATFRQWYP